MIAHNVSIATSCKRAALRFASRHVLTVVTLTAVTVSAVELPILWAQTAPVIVGRKVPTPPPPPANSHAKNTKTTSNGSITITFRNCRENDKQHVSCNFEDDDGNTHWVYLPGVSLPASE